MEEMLINRLHEVESHNKELTDLLKESDLNRRLCSILNETNKIAKQYGNLCRLEPGQEEDQIIRYKAEAGKVNDLEEQIVAFRDKLDTQANLNRVLEDSLANQKTRKIAGNTVKVRSLSKKLKACSGPSRVSTPRRPTSTTKRFSKARLSLK